MISKHTASLKHAEHYANMILLADQMYEKGGSGVEKGLKHFDDNWKNIELGQKCDRSIAGKKVGKMDVGRLADRPTSDEQKGTPTCASI